MVSTKYKQSNPRMQCVRLMGMPRFLYFKCYSSVLMQKKKPWINVKNNEVDPPNLFALSCLYCRCIVELDLSCLLWGGSVIFQIQPARWYSTVLTHSWQPTPLGGSVWKSAKTSTPNSPSLPYHPPTLPLMLFLMLVKVKFTDRSTAVS